MKPKSFSIIKQTYNFLFSYKVSITLEIWHRQKVLSFITESGLSFSNLIGFKNKSNETFVRVLYLNPIFFS